MVLAVGGGSSRVCGEGVTKAELYKDRDGENSPLATSDSSVRQLHRTTFCTLTHSSLSMVGLMRHWWGSRRELHLKGRNATPPLEKNSRKQQRKLPRTAGVSARVAHNHRGGR